MAKEPIEEVALFGIVGGGEAAINHMNAVGSRGSNGWERVPTPEPNDRLILEEAGVVFGEVLNSLFIQVRYPEGWTVQSTDHYMYKKLLNARKQAWLF